jgi:hypothetical protein
MEKAKRFLIKKIPSKVALKYGFSRKLPKWYRLVQMDMICRVVNNHSMSAVKVLLSIDNWEEKQRQEKWKQERNQENLD